MVQCTHTQECVHSILCGQQLIYQCNYPNTDCQKYMTQVISWLTQPRVIAMCITTSKLQYGTYKSPSSFGHLAYILVNVSNRWAWPIFPFWFHCNIQSKPPNIQQSWECYREICFQISIACQESESNWLSGSSQTLYCGCTSANRVQFTRVRDIDIGKHKKWKVRFVTSVNKKNIWFSASFSFLIFFPDSQTVSPSIYLMFY